MVLVFGYLKTDTFQGVSKSLDFRRLQNLRVSGSFIFLRYWEVQKSNNLGKNEGSRKFGMGVCMGSNG